MQMKIDKNIGVLLIFGWIVLFSSSCSQDNSILDQEEQISLSILLNSQRQGELRLAGDPNVSEESKIYSLVVLVFKSAGEPQAGKLDGYKSIVREDDEFGKPYKEISEIKQIKLTAGKRDIYVVANAPNLHFASVTNFQDFLAKCEDLSDQGVIANSETIDPSEDLPIGGILPTNAKTNLTMCNYMTNVLFSTSHEQHYLGYTTNAGRPTDVSSDYGFTLDDDNAFKLERLVARVAIQKVEFELPKSLPFEGSDFPSSLYSYSIDSVFMMNVKTTSRYAFNTNLEFDEKFGHGCRTGYIFLNSLQRISNLNQQSEYKDFLMEPISTPFYDINNNATPLWFYAFDNWDSNCPTYLVVGVRYNFKSSKDNNVKTVKSYYQVVVNSPKTGKLANHDYIRRNNQYRISIKIKGLGDMYGYNPELLKTLSVGNTDLEVTETVGENLFPWTGNTYSE